MSHAPEDAAKPVEFGKLVGLTRYVGEPALTLADREGLLCPR